VAALVHVFTDLTELHHIHGPHEMSPVKVLLVDDNKVSQVLVATILRKWSHEVTTVTNGKEAIDAHKNQGFDVIIMDLNMPIMDGFQAAGVIRETEKDGRRRVPIIALTSSASERDRCLKEGLDEFLVKPVNYSDLASAIQRSLRATGESKGDRELFDGSRLKGKFEGSTRVLRLTIDKFIDLCPEMISQIKQAIAHHQPESLAFAANDLRMNLTVFGPSRAAEKAIRLEQMGKSEVLDGADLTFKELEADLQEVLLSLPSLLAESMAWNTPHRTAS
jgi:CheY-like chemotaxis protein